VGTGLRRYDRESIRQTRCNKFQIPDTDWNDADQRFEDRNMRGRLEARLYLTPPLAAGAAVVLAPGQTHHLRTVLRLAPGAAVSAFNGRDGEWLCRIAELDRDRGSLAVEQRLRPVEPEADLWLVFAPIKRARLDWLVEKATELGVSALLPVWTRHTQAERLNLDRLRAHAVAAAEQSERLSVPELRAPHPLDAILGAWPAERRLIVCDETGEGEPIGAALAGLGPGPTAFLTGPEGGFAETELASLSKFTFVSRVGLGPRVLRADTAALAALSAFQAIAGDWRRTRSVDRVPGSAT
jgi:16S rRNA (uracil1498-N3)-methyltransferase